MIGIVVRRLRRSTARLRRLARSAFLALARRSPNESAILLLLGIAIGAAGAGGVIAFYRVIDLSDVLLHQLARVLVPGAEPLVFRPVLTALAVGTAWWIMAKGAPGEDGFTLPDVRRRLTDERARIPLRGTLLRTAASAVTVGGGGFAGSEGPTAVLGAGLGSSIARFTRADPSRSTMLASAGAAAGISASFNAPLAGAFFALEECVGSLDSAAFSPVVVASVVAAVLSRAVFGNHPAFPIPAEYGYREAGEVLLWFPLLGCLIGAAAVPFIRFHFALGDRLRAVRLPRGVVAVAAGALVGGIAYAAGGYFGGGGHVAFPLDAFGRLEWPALVALAAAMAVAMSLTLQGGGSGGVFLPSLGVGAALGAAYGGFLRDAMPSLQVQAETYALVGMGGMVAAATGAPITGVLLVFEMTNDYALMPALMITVVLASIVARHFEPDSLYTGWLRRRAARDAATPTATADEAPAHAA